MQRVRCDWIDGYLTHSLGVLAPIELPLAPAPKAITTGWEFLVQSSDGPARQPPSNIIDAFDASYGALLILGGPGSGKTTLLLELARQLLDRAERDMEAPVPVYVSLSSWAHRKLPVEDWLAEELHHRYDIRFAVARNWVQRDRVIPLLDGLDEVASAQRDLCVTALNRFRSDHGVLPIVVCSRLEEYQHLRGRLRLTRAVAIQPLPLTTIKECLDRLGAPLKDIRETVEHDATVQELFATPLMLAIAALAYTAPNEPSPPPLDPESDPQRQLLTLYVQRMFHRRTHNRTYRESQTRQWLAWLAHTLRQQNQSMFRLDSLRPHWLPTWRQAFLVEAICAVTLSIILGALFGVGLDSSLTQ